MNLILQTVIIINFLLRYPMVSPIRACRLLRCYQLIVCLHLESKRPLWVRISRFRIRIWAYKTLILIRRLQRMRKTKKNALDYVWISSIRLRLNLNYHDYQECLVPEIIITILLLTIKQTQKMLLGFPKSHLREMSSVSIQKCATLKSNKFKNQCLESCKNINKLYVTKWNKFK